MAQVLHKIKNFIKNSIFSVMLGVAKSIGYVPYKDDKSNEKRIESDK